ncbi:MAG: bifunctional DNA primase/polymerase [Verrucomicrobia bacterium]|nr:bifunctional DNA primase/polymerase [Verrucomicrobiota bacterium]
MTPSIPPDINTLDRLAAAQFYANTLGWAVHPLLAPDKGDPQERGKKPLLKGWRNHIAADITPDFLTRFFGPGTNNNIGCVVRPPFVHVDLDSKPDAGASVMEWLATQPELAAVPRERTGGGAHLAFVCRDMPEAVMKAKKAPACQITGRVSAELYLDGLNLVLAPSVHKSGHTYQWEVTGDIPEVKWDDLCRWFGFAAPEARKPGRPAREKPWWSKWDQDLRTLDLAGVMEDLGGLGACLDPDTNKWSVRCPWETEHGAGPCDAPGSDTIIFNQPETMPGFKCLHAHCEARGIRDLVEWAERQRPGIIASRCANLRVWQPGNSDAKGRPQIVLPALGRAHGAFGTELGNLIAPKLDMFRFADNVVEIRTIRQADKKGAIPGQMLAAIKPAELVTAVERTVETGVIREDEAGDGVFVPKSMSEQDARITLVSGFFGACLPRVSRLLDVPVPHFSDDGKVVYPKPGYDERFGTWLNPQAPQLRTMGHAEALRWLCHDLFGPPDQGGFWWHDEQARVHALARFVTPFCRGLMEWRRTPLWIFDGNREGCGKDTCADLTHIAYTGRSVICAPLSKDCDDEMRKRITSALMAGSRFFHLANMKGHVRYASLEAATDDSGVWEDRRLGVSETITLPNETEYSFSANNATWEPDIERRCRRIRLRFTPDDINGHRYRHTDIRGWVRRHRSELLSAVAALVSEWVRQGCPPGPSPFTSFPEWGRVVGGILHCAGLPDPCLPHEDSQSSGDQSTRAMRDFFAVVFERFGDREILKREFQEFVQHDESVHELFDWIDFAARRGLMSFGRLIARFDKRELGGITFRLRMTSKNCGTYRFFRAGEGELQIRPSLPEAATPEQGLRDFEGLSTPSHTRGENACEKNKNEMQLTAPNMGDREKSPEVPKSLLPVFCSTRGDLDRIAADLAGASRIALDIETYGQAKGDGLDPWKGDIRLLTVSKHGGTVWTIDLRATGYELGPLKRVLDDAHVIIHNARFDLLWLRVKCGLNARKALCTLTAARLLAAGTKPGNDLDKCLERYLRIPPAADHSRSDWASMLLTEDQLAYAARDVAHLHDLLAVMEGEIEMAELGDVWALESALLPCVVDMESAGIRVEREKLESIAATARQREAQAAAGLREALGNPSLNPASPGQLLAALRGKGLALESTAEEHLKAADDGHLVPLVLDYREAGKQAQQAVALIGHIRSDGRIHGLFDPLGTATGRFSSKEPNLQNIGRGELREAFSVPEGKRLIVADYSQIELRAAAAIAGETRMIEAYKAGADLHKLTAATVLGKPEDAVTKADRQLAKAVNFGLIYGQSAPGLVKYAATSYGVAMTGDEAFAIRTAFFRTYSRLRQWHGQSHNTSEAGIAEVRTRTGRRRLIPGNSTPWERFTALVNTPVQGGTADGMKRAIVLLSGRLPEGAMIVSTVHDELVVECPEESAEPCRQLVMTAMVSAMSALFPEVPVGVEANVCTTWAEK